MYESTSTYMSLQPAATRHKRSQRHVLSITASPSTTSPHPKVTRLPDYPLIPSTRGSNNHTRQTIPSRRTRRLQSDVRILRTTPRRPHPTLQRPSLGLQNGLHLPPLPRLQAPTRASSTRLSTQQLLRLRPHPQRLPPLYPLRIPKGRQMLVLRRKNR